MKYLHIQAIGHLLATYREDLVYISNFHKYKNEQISKKEFIKKDTGMFYKFLIDFSVTRNFIKGSTPRLLDVTTNWIHGKYPDDVDKFAKELNRKGLTHNHIATVLSSKILMLNNPWLILPIDKWARIAVKHKKNMYDGYLDKIDKYKKVHNIIINQCIESVAEHLNLIELEFRNELSNFEQIKINRFIDKLLWTVGQYEK